MRIPAGAKAGATAGVLLAVNVLVCGRLFTTEYLSRMDSIEGAFIALARYIQQNWGDLTWFPLWFAGMPFQNVYPPLLHGLVAAVATLLGWSPALAYHVTVALFYCLGPVALFWLAWKWHGNLWAAFLAALAYSLLSPSGWLALDIRADMGGFFHARRLQNLVVYGEGPHVAALTLIPLAILGLEMAFTRRRIRYLLAALAGLAAVVLMNWPGAIGLTLAVVAWIASQRGRDVPRAAAMTLGLAAVGYLIVSPLCPPSTLQVVLFNAQRAGGEYVFGLRHLVWAGVAVVLLGLLRQAALRLGLPPLARFALLFAALSGAIVVAASYGLYLVPQPRRFHLEFEMAICLLAGWGCASLTAPSRWRLGAASVAVLAGVQFVNYYRYAHELIQPIDIRQTVEYQAATWLDRNMRDARVFAPGSISFWMNVFTDTPQLVGCCDQSTPNWESRVAAYTIYTDENAGGKEAYYSLVWLKAFGVQAIGAGGPRSREHYRPYRHPHKFDGILKEIWRDGDDVLLEVPHRSAGLAHVIQEANLVRRAPAHGLDVAPILPYIAALDDPSLPLASFWWRNRHQALIRARLAKGDLVSVQVSYAPGWHATVNGSPRPVFPDGIGLVAIRPACEGDCTIELSYDGGLEMTVARWASYMTLAALLLVAAKEAVSYQLSAKKQEADS
jgi:hypothetical protein